MTRTPLRCNHVWHQEPHLPVTSLNDQNSFQNRPRASLRGARLAIAPRRVLRHGSPEVRVRLVFVASHRRCRKDRPSHAPPKLGDCRVRSHLAPKTPRSPQPRREAPEIQRRVSCAAAAGGVPRQLQRAASRPAFCGPSDSMMISFLSSILYTTNLFSHAHNARASRLSRLRSRLRQLITRSGAGDYRYPHITAEIAKLHLYNNHKQ